MKLLISEEVCEALARRAPVVALETSVVAQGLPSPVNLETARACEAAIRTAGAIPAATAVVDGVVKVGLSASDLEQLASGDSKLFKLGSRDLPMAVHGRKSGGTTVSATCEIAAAAGIRMFATGGIGGVHRGAEKDFDLSQDLWALSRFPVAVVCAGAKSVLDLPKTLELLETLAVPVLGVGTRELPSFYSVSSGLRLEHQVVDAAEAADFLRCRYETLSQGGGTLLALPPPTQHAIPADEVEVWIAEALRTAVAQGIQGKAATPFLLGELTRRSGGRTQKANIALLENNARFAAEVAVAWSHTRGT